jgi:hypothetical protein
MAKHLGSKGDVLSSHDAREARHVQVPFSVLGSS